MRAQRPKGAAHLEGRYHQDAGPQVRLALPAYRALVFHHCRVIIYRAVERTYCKRPLFEPNRQGSRQTPRNVIRASARLRLRKSSSFPFGALISAGKGR